MPHVDIYRSSLESEALAIVSKLKKYKLNPIKTTLATSASPSTLGSGVSQGMVWVVSVPNTELSRVKRILRSKLLYKRMKLSRRYRTRHTTRGLGIAFAVLAIAGLFILFR